MMTKTFRTLPALAGAAALALTLSACGSDEPATTPAPAPAATTEAAPSAPATSAAPSASASADDDSSPSSSPSTSASTPSGNTSTVPENSAEVDVDDQRGDGTSITLQQVRITEGTGFVAIYTRDNVLLGSAEVTPNDAPTSIKLSDPVPATGELTAVLFGDDGDGKFDAEKDPRLVEADDDDDNDDNDADDNDTIEEDFDYTLV